MPAPIPFRPCEVYTTPNVVACQKGYYAWSIQAIKERIVALTGKRRSAAETTELDLLQQVWAERQSDPNATRVCRTTFDGWQEMADHPHKLAASHPDAKNRGPPEHWAFCFAPATKTAAPPTTRGTKTDTTLYTMNGIPQRRLRFTSLSPADVRDAYCSMPLKKPPVVPRTFLRIHMASCGKTGAGAVLVRYENNQFSPVPTSGEGWAARVGKAFYDDDVSATRYLWKPRVLRTNVYALVIDDCGRVSNVRRIDPWQVDMAALFGLKPHVLSTYANAADVRSGNAVTLKARLVTVQNQRVLQANALIALEKSIDVAEKKAKAAAASKSSKASGPAWLSSFINVQTAASDAEVLQHKTARDLRKSTLEELTRRARAIGETHESVLFRQETLAKDTLALLKKWGKPMTTPSAWQSNDNHLYVHIPDI